jgi:hypothetical protein
VTVEGATEAPPRRRTSIVLALACAALAVLVVLLVQQNAALRRQLEGALQTRGEAAFPNGEKLDSLTSFVAASGEPAGLPARPLDFADGRVATLVVVVSGNCEVCESSLPAIERLTAAAAKAGTWVVALQTDAKAPDQLKYLDRGFAVCGVPDVRETWIRRVDGVPAFLLVDGTGSLRASAWGLLDDEREANLVRAIEAGAAGWTR